MADFKDNFEAATTFLELAIEQMRAVDASAASFIQEHFQAPLQQAFDHYFKHVDFDNLNIFEKTTSMRLVQLGQQLLEKQVQTRPLLAPPGLGFKLFRDSRMANADNFATTRSSSAPQASIWDTPLRFRKISPYGAVGDKPQEASPQNNSPLQLTPRKQDGLSERQWSHPTSPTNFSATTFRTRQLTPPDDEPMKGLASPTETTLKPCVASSWAKVAALPGNSPPVATINLSGQVNKMKDQPSKAGSRLVKRRIPREVEQDQKRVVWAVNLPKGTSLRDVSSHIDVGPVMSILLQYDINASYPGVSACIIFHKAESALACVTSRRLCWADGINAFLGQGFPMDEDVLSMNFPTMARRRLKWSHAQLFHSVSLKEFKLDIFEICGVDNVELVHFYNPGEVTIIFSSVSVATFVMEKFVGLANEVGNKYRRVDVSYARDFNERPPTDIKSSYAPGDVVRRVAFDSALPGLYPGPLVHGK